METKPIAKICAFAHQHANDLVRIEELVGYVADHRQEYSLVDLHEMAECFEALLRGNARRDMRTFELSMRLVDIRFR